jgi:DNA invertase Pin-like site-specific DNA recombinase
VVWKLDRLGRNMLHILETVKALTDRGATLVSVTDGVCGAPRILPDLRAEHNA